MSFVDITSLYTLKGYIYIYMVPHCVLLDLFVLGQYLKTPPLRKGVSVRLCSFGAKKCEGFSLFSWYAM